MQTPHTGLSPKGITNEEKSTNAQITSEVVKTYATNWLQGNDQPIRSELFNFNAGVDTCTDFDGAEPFEACQTFEPISIKPEKLYEEVAYGIPTHVIEHHTFPYDYQPDTKVTMRSSLLSPFPSRKIIYSGEETLPKTSFSTHKLVKGQEIGSSSGSEEFFSQFTKRLPNDFNAENNATLKNEGGTFYLACDLLLSSSGTEDSDYELVDLGNGPGSRGKKDSPYVIHSSDDTETIINNETQVIQRKAQKSKKTKIIHGITKKNVATIAADHIKKSAKKTRKHKSITTVTSYQNLQTTTDDSSLVKPAKKCKKIDKKSAKKSSETSNTYKSGHKSTKPKTKHQKKSAKKSTVPLIHNDLPVTHEATLITEVPKNSGPNSVSVVNEIHETNNNDQASSSSVATTKIMEVLHQDQPTLLQPSRYTVTSDNVLIPLVVTPERANVVAHAQVQEENSVEHSMHRAEHLLSEIEKIVGHKSRWPFRIYKLYVARRLSYMNTFIVAIFGYINKVPVDLLTNYLDANGISKNVSINVCHLYISFQNVPEHFKRYYSFNVKADRLVYLKDFQA